MSDWVRAIACVIMRASREHFGTRNKTTPQSAAHSNLLLFADDAKCGRIKDVNLLQDDLKFLTQLE